MTIDEAIEHAEERACGNDRCAKDHTQLADWLRELRRARMEIDLLKTLRDGFKADAQKYKAENAKLRELVRILYYCGLPWKNCDKCAMNGAEMHVKISDVQFCDDMYDRMRELGVKVDE